MINASIDQFLCSLSIDRSPQTRAWYSKRLKPLRELCGPLSAITLTDLNRTYARLAGRQEQYVNHPSGRESIHKPLSPATLRGYVRAWRAFFNWCVESDLLPFSPARKLKLPRLPDQPPKAITHSDLELIVEAARQSSARDYAIVCILADSACRAGGLCAITLDNLDLDQQQAIVISKGQTAFLLFTDRTVTAISEYLCERPSVPYRELFIGQKMIPLKAGGIHALLDRLATAAGVQGRHNPHAFRHAWARQAIQRGADLSEVGQVLGHRQAQTTYQFYGRWSTTELHAIHARFTNLRTDVEVSAETSED